MAGSQKKKSSAQMFKFAHNSLHDKYNIHIKFRKYVAALTDHHIAAFREEFETWDRDKSGYISKDELAVVLRGLGEDPTDSDIMKMVQQVDVNNDQKIEFDEFLTMMAIKMFQECDQDSLIDAFRAFDPDNTGKITASRFKDVFSVFDGGPDALSAAEVDEMVRMADVDGDGNVNYEEFASYILSSSGLSYEDMVDLHRPDLNEASSASNTGKESTMATNVSESSNSTTTDAAK